MKYCLLMLTVLAAGGPVFGGAPDSSSPDLQELEEVVVKGRVPGPPLWKISKGEHVLWILPLVDIYPKNIKWDSAPVESLMAESQEYLYRPRNGVEVSSISTGAFSMLRALSAYNKLRHLPRGTSLSDFLTPDLYTRLLALRSRYFPRKKISNLTVWEVRRLLEQEALDHERLAMVDYSEFTSPLVVTRNLLKWLNKSRLNRRTSTSYGRRDMRMTCSARRACIPRLTRAGVHPSSWRSRAIRSWSSCCATILDLRRTTSPLTGSGASDGWRLRSACWPATPRHSVCCP